MVKNHVFKKKLEKEEKPFKCKKCSKKYANSGTLHRHKSVHSERKNFKCEVCGKEFKTDVSLRGHKISHLEKTIQCNSCPMLFKGTHQLKSHINDIHTTGKSAYQCQICLKTFTQKGTLKRHELIHLPPKEECDICGWKFHNINDLRKHRMKHRSGESLRQWIGLDCKACSQSFRNGTELKNTTKFSTWMLFLNSMIENVNHVK